MFKKEKYIDVATHLGLSEASINACLTKMILPPRENKRLCYQYRQVSIVSIG